VLPGAGVGDVRAIVDGVTMGLGLALFPPQPCVSAATKSRPAPQAMTLHAGIDSRN
jgi:hypothetical protein